MHCAKNRNAGFTLVELLVVVAIIAIIGAGVAVTYRNLDAKAKTAMEMSDCNTLKKVISHWSAINDYRLVNKLDCLIDTDGNLYSSMPTMSSFSGTSEPNAYGRGLQGPVGYTLMAEEAPDVVLTNLASAGMTRTYRHKADATNANDSTFETGTFAGEVDTSDTLSLIANDDNYQDYVDGYQSVIDEESNVTDYFADTANTDPYTFTSSDGTSYSWASLAEYNNAKAEAEGARNAPRAETLAFIYPEGGAQMSVQAGPMTLSGTAPMNLTNEIISNIGLTAADVADPRNDTASEVADGKRYYLVVMGLGRFASIYGGKSVRIDTPAFGKRQGQSEGYYNRYLAVIRVPTTAYDSMTGKGESASIVDILTPQGYSVAALRDNYIADEANVKD